MSVRPAQLNDMLILNSCNLLCLPENYETLHNINHFLAWSELTFVIENENGELAGYIMGKMVILPDGQRSQCGLVTSINLKHKLHRMLYARKLLDHCTQAMVEIYNAYFSSFYVRVSDPSVMSLYMGALNFKIVNVIPNYYTDGEDAFLMALDLRHHYGWLRPFICRCPKISDKELQAIKDRSSSTISEDASAKS